MQDWDRHAIEMLDRCPSEKCFLSHYPPAVGDPGYQIPVLCKSHFDAGAQMPSFEARNFNIDVGTPYSSIHFPCPKCALLWGPLKQNVSETRCRKLVPAKHNLGSDIDVSIVMHLLSLPGGIPVPSESHRGQLPSLSLHACRLC